MAVDTAHGVVDFSTQKSYIETIDDSALKKYLQSCDNADVINLLYQKQLIRFV